MDELDDYSKNPEATYKTPSGEVISLYREGKDDYWAYFPFSDYSVRGNLIDVIREVIESLDAGK